MARGMCVAVKRTAQAAEGRTAATAGRSERSSEQGGKAAEARNGSREGRASAWLRHACLVLALPADAARPCSLPRALDPPTPGGAPARVLHPLFRDRSDGSHGGQRQMKRLRDRVAGRANQSCTGALALRVLVLMRACPAQAQAPPAALAAAQAFQGPRGGSPAALALCASGWLKRLRSRVHTARLKHRYCLLYWAPRTQIRSGAPAASCIPCSHTPCCIPHALQP